MYNIHWWNHERRRLEHRYEVPKRKLPAVEVDVCQILFYLSVYKNKQNKNFYFVSGIT